MLPFTEAGKINRSALIAERSQAPLANSSMSSTS
jgi:hypothetical protein